MSTVTENMGVALAMLFPDATQEQAAVFEQTINALAVQFEGEVEVSPLAISTPASANRVFQNLVYLHNDLVNQIRATTGQMFVHYKPTAVSSSAELLVKIKGLITSIKQYRTILNTAHTPMDSSLVDGINEDLETIYGTS